MGLFFPSLHPQEGDGGGCRSVVPKRMVPYPQQRQTPPRRGPGGPGDPPPPQLVPGDCRISVASPKRGDGGFDSLREGGRERKSDRLARRRSQWGCLVLTGFYSLFNYTFVKLKKRKRKKGEKKIPLVSL